MVRSTDEKVAPGGWEPDERIDAESMIAHVGAGKVLELGSHALDQQLTKPRVAQNTLRGSLRGGRKPTSTVALS